MNETSFGKNLDKLMRIRHISDRELARLCSLCPSSIYRIRTDKTEPKRETIIQIAEALGVSPFDLFDYNEEFTEKTSGKRALTMKPISAEMYCKSNNIKDKIIIATIDQIMKLALAKRNKNIAA